MTNLANCDSIALGLYSRETEKRFCKIYGNVISNYFEFSQDLISGAKEIVNSKNENKEFKSELLSYQLAFLLSFGVQDTCLSSRKFYESIMRDPKIIDIFSRSNPVKLLCLDSESLPTVIGVCQVINEIAKEFGSGGKLDFTEIRILVLDNREKWRRLCEYIIDTANSYFTNIELKLCFVENFLSWSIQEFNDVIKEFHLLIIARIYAEELDFNYKHMRIVLNEMKEDAIMFYLDSCNERFYDNLNNISKTLSFSQIKSCQKLQASFAELGDEHFYFDLPVFWDKDFQPVMFSTWIKDFAVLTDSLPEVVEPIVSNELNSNKSNNSAMLNLTNHVPNSKITKTCTSEQMNTVAGKKKVKSSTKQSNQTAKKRRSKAKKAAENKKNHELLENIISILNKEIICSTTTKPTQNLQCSNDPCDAAISQKVIAKTENQIHPAKGVGCKSSISYTTQIVKSEGKAKAATSKTSSSTSKIVSKNQGDLTLITKQAGNGNASSSVSKANGSQSKNKAKLSEKSTKNKTNSKSLASKDEIKTKSNKNNSPVTTTPEVQTEKSFGPDLPKKSSKTNSAKTKKVSNTTEKVKLTGKFAHMDLEKKNKDERHKMRAKKASFAKHANFDYDD